MSFQRLPNYIRTHRRRSALSQEEVAFLLDCRGGAKVCRYERFARQPTLETALALEILFRTPVRGLFAGIGDQVERKVVRRAKILAAELENEPQDRVTRSKIEMLKAVCDGLQPSIDHA